MDNNETTDPIIALINKLVGIEHRYQDYMARWDAGPAQPDEWHTTAARSADDVSELLHLLEDERAKVGYLRAWSDSLMQLVPDDYEAPVSPLPPDGSRPALVTQEQVISAWVDGLVHATVRKG